MSCRVGLVSFIFLSSRYRVTDLQHLNSRKLETKFSDVTLETHSGSIFEDN